MDHVLDILERYLVQVFDETVIRPAVEGAVAVTADEMVLEFLVVSAQVGIGVEHFRHVPPGGGIERVEKIIAVVVRVGFVELGAVRERRRVGERLFRVTVFQDQRTESGEAGGRFVRRGLGLPGGEGDKFLFEFRRVIASARANGFAGERGELLLGVGTEPAQQRGVIEQQPRQDHAIAEELGKDIILAVSGAAENLPGVIGQATFVGAERAGDQQLGERRNRGVVRGAPVVAIEERLERIVMVFHLAQQPFDGAELRDAVLVILVLEQAGELDPVDGMLPGAFEQGIGGAENNGVEIGRDILETWLGLDRELSGMATGGVEPDPRNVGQVRPGVDLGRGEAGHKHGQGGIDAAEFAQDQ